MTDVFTSEKRSAVMAAIRAKNTKPEVIVRRVLHLMGYRFRLHVSDLPGKPDIVIPKIRIIVQVKGCFWHGHHCLGGRVPEANRAYWEPKIAGNRARDRRNDRRLRAMGWQVKTIWECKIRRSSPLDLHEELRRSLKINSSRVSKTRLSKLESALARIRLRKTPERPSSPPSKASLGRVLRSVTPDRQKTKAKAAGRYPER